MIVIRKIKIHDILSLRYDYLNSLPEFQDLFIELMVKDSAKFSIEIDNEQAGYLIVPNEKILIEFFLRKRFIPKSLDVFNSVTNQLNIKTIYCKSFDFQLLNCCLLSTEKFNIIGALYRDFVKTANFFNNKLLQMKIATEDDLPMLIEIDDEVFEPKNELSTAVKNKNIYLFYKDDLLAGCGFLTRIHPDWIYYDLGVWTNPDFRKQGIATQIVSHLKSFCISNKGKPICGCDINNIASQKTLEKNGFMSCHKLIEFTL